MSQKPDKALPTRKVRIGTTGTALGDARANAVSAALAAVPGSSVELVRVDALSDALAAGECDAVVHAADELPIGGHPGLVVAAIMKRTDARDALCARDGAVFDTLDDAARVAIGLPRRAAQVRHRKPGLRIIESSAASDALLAELDAGAVDAVVVSVSDLALLGRLDSVTEYLGLDGWPTSAGQGALAIEVRAGDESLVKRLDHAQTQTIVTAERTTQAIVAAQSAAPIAVHGLVEEGLLFLSARVFSVDSAEHVTSSHALYLSDVKNPALEIAERVADELIELGAVGLASPSVRGGAA